MVHFQYDSFQLQFVLRQLPVAHLYARSWAYYCCAGRSV